MGTKKKPVYSTPSRSSQLRGDSELTVVRHTSKVLRGSGAVSGEFGGGNDIQNHVIYQKSLVGLPVGFPHFQNSVGCKDKLSFPMKKYYDNVTCFSKYCRIARCLCKRY